VKDLEAALASELLSTEVSSDRGSPRRSRGGMEGPSAFLHSLDLLQEARTDELCRDGGLRKAQPNTDNSQSTLASRMPTFQNIENIIQGGGARLGEICNPSVAKDEPQSVGLSIERVTPRSFHTLESCRSCAHAATDRTSGASHTSSPTPSSTKDALFSRPNSDVDMDSPTRLSRVSRQSFASGSFERTTLRSNVSSSGLSSTSHIVQTMGELAQLDARVLSADGVPSVTSRPRHLPLKLLQTQSITTVTAASSSSIVCLEADQSQPDGHEPSNADHTAQSSPNKQCQNFSLAQLPATTEKPHRRCMSHTADATFLGESPSFSPRRCQLQTPQRENSAPSNKSSLSVCSVDLKCESTSETQHRSCSPADGMSRGRTRHRGPNISTTSTGSNSQDDDEKKPPGGYVRQLAAATLTLVSGPTNEVQSVRLAREDELIELTQSDPGVCSLEDVASDAGDCCDTARGDDPTPSRRTPQMVPERYVGCPLWLRVCGILPWERSSALNLHRQQLASANRYTLLALAVLALIVCTQQMVHGQSNISDKNCQEGKYHDLQQLSDLVIALGSLIGLVAIWAVPNCNLLGNSGALLVACARRQGVVEAWSKSSWKQNLVMGFLWGCSLLVRAMGAWSAGWCGAVGAATFFFTSGVFMALTFALLHVNCSLTLLIDAYCSYLTERPELDCCVREWNILQAVLRKASGAVEKGFVALQTTALVTVLLGVADLFLHGNLLSWNLLAFMLLALSEARLIFKSAEVTEKCIRLPSLINSLSFGCDVVDMGRHYLVEYITYSGAGFYVGEVRLTKAMAIKLVYVVGLVAFGVITRAVSTSSG